MNDKFWKVSMYGVIEYEFEREQSFYFLTEKEANEFLEGLKKIYIKEDGRYLPNYTHIEFDIDTISFDQLKREATVEEIEELFGINVKLEDIMKGRVL